ncbi:hypothetical protein WJX79_002095 [Trebouxia sp. C0005]
MRSDRAPADNSEGLSVFRLTYSNEAATCRLTDEFCRGSATPQGLSRISIVAIPYLALGTHYWLAVTESHLHIIHTCPHLFWCAQ